VRLAPLVSIDLILRDPEGMVLLGRRTNEPAKGVFFVPGGIVLKNERLGDAFARILTAETGLTTPFSQARLLGAYDHIYPPAPGGDAYGRHYVVLGHVVDFARRPGIRPDAQHDVMRWMGIAEILRAPDVHANTKAYFS
jgi:colanic acid biosynthesis protein WcaH